MPEEDLLVAVVEVPGTRAEAAPTGWGWDPTCWKKLQEGDTTLKTVRVPWLPRAPKQAKLAASARKLLHQWRQLGLKDGVECQTKALWEAYLTESGHHGVERTMSLLRRGFHWLVNGRDNLFVSVLSVFK